MMKAAVVGWTAVIATFSGPVPAQKADLDWIIRDDLEAGEILIDFSSDEHYTEHIRAAALIDAPAEKIWAILKDCERAPEYIPHIQACELLETQPDQRAQIFRQRVKLAWFLPSFEHNFRLNYEPYSRIDVSHVSGPINVLDGTWWLVSDENPGTILIYLLSFEPDFPIPRFVISHMLTRDVPAILAKVRDRAEAAFAVESAL
jgi:ribosome-associated toxin RatA of RatAB toxin-antitoxin module